MKSSPLIKGKAAKQYRSAGRQSPPYTLFQAKPAGSARQFTVEYQSRMWVTSGHNGCRDRCFAGFSAVSKSQPNQLKGYDCLAGAG